MPLFLAFHDRIVAVDAPPAVAAEIAAFFCLCRAAPTATPYVRATITEDAPDRFRLEFPPHPAVPNLSRGEVIARLARTMHDHLWFDGPGVPLRAGAVSWGEKAALVLAREGEGASSLIAWLLEKGFAYLADAVVVLAADAGTIAGFPEPLALAHDRIRHFAELPTLQAAPSLRAGDRVLVQPDPSWLAGEPVAECGLILDARFEPGADLRLEAVPADQLALRLLEQTQRVVIPGDPGYAPVSELAASAFALRLTYGSYGQLDGVLDFLMRLVLEAAQPPEEIAAFLGGLGRLSGPGATTSPPKRYPIPAPSDRTFSPKLTIGMATYDDYDGVYFTIQSMRLYHPEVMADVEFVVVDNHPDGICAEPLKDLENSVPNYRYVPLPHISGTAQSRNRIFTEAGGEFVLCVDCHVLIVPGALRRLLAYFAARSDTADLLQGPLLADNLRTVSTHFDPVWSAGMYGVWANNPVGDDIDASPFEIPMQGLGLFACRRAAWLGFNPLFSGFGGEEGYIHEKYRQAGHRTLCLPFLRWVHRFQRPLGPPYRNVWEDRCRNYVIGHRELGLPTSEMEAHFTELLGADHAARIFANIRSELGADA